MGETDGRDVGNTGVYERNVEYRWEKQVEDVVGNTGDKWKKHRT